MSFIGLVPGAEHEKKYFGQGKDLIARQRALSDTALSNGGVNYVYLYDRDQLVTTEYYQQNKGLLDQPRGCGFWAWKPYIILQTLAKAKPNDYVIYCDVGKPNESSKVDHGNIITTSLVPLVEWAERHGGMLPGVYLSNHGPAKDWIKRDCYQLMQCDEARYHNMPTVQAGYTVWKNTPEVICFLRQWQKFNSDPRLISDQDNTLGLDNYAGFQRHCHDQATLTLLCEQKRLSVFGDRKHQFLGFRNINFISHQAAYENALSKGELLLGTLNQTNAILPKFCVRWVELLYQYRRDKALNIGLIGKFDEQVLQAWQRYFPHARIDVTTLKTISEKNQHFDLLLSLNLPVESFTNQLLIASYKALTLDGVFFLGPLPNSPSKSELEVTARSVSSVGRFPDNAVFKSITNVGTPKVSNSRNPIFVSGKSTQGQTETMCIMIKPSEGASRD